MKLTAMVMLALCIISGCSQESDLDKYNKLVKEELGSGKKVDSIFFGIHLGMRRKDFYMHCWEMNKKELFRDGIGNMYVLYRLEKELRHPAAMNFYPDFHDSAISKMRTIFQYDGWAPWNKHLGADSLLPDVLSMYTKWYDKGNPFLKLPDGKENFKYAKVDGNRLITIRKADDVVVEANYTDLGVENNNK
jgi:hypothetical protein